MSSYLEVSVARMNVLICAADVHEILKLSPETNGDRAFPDGFRLWRDQLLRRVSCRDLLGLPPDPTEERVGIVYSPDNSDSPPIFLEADNVVKRDQATDKKSKALPLVPKRIAALLDKNTSKSLGMQVFHVASQSAATDYHNVFYDMSLGFHGVV